MAGSWREIAAERAALGHASEQEIVADARATLFIVEHTLVGLMAAAAHEPAPASSHSPLWCAAQALDVTALVWHHARPAAGRRFGTLGAHLHQRMREDAAPSAALVAASARIADDALEQIAQAPSAPRAALAALQDASVTLAAIAIRLWSETPDPRTDPPGTSGAAAAIARLSIELLDVAAAELCATSCAREGAGDWLGVLLARRGPEMALALLDDPAADRVLAAEAATVIRAAWISRAALELLTLRGLLNETRPRRRGPSPVQSIAAARALTRLQRTPRIAHARRWRAHSLALARCSATYLRACATNDARNGQSRAELLDLLAESLTHAARLETRLSDNGGSDAPPA